MGQSLVMKWPSIASPAPAVVLRVSEQCPGKRRGNRGVEVRAAESNSDRLRAPYAPPDALGSAGCGPGRTGRAPRCPNRWSKLRPERLDGHAVLSRRPEVVARACVRWPFLERGMTVLRPHTSPHTKRRTAPCRAKCVLSPRSKKLPASGPVVASCGETWTGNKRGTSSTDSVPSQRVAWL